MKTATYLKNLEGWKGDARLYKLSEPHEGHDYVIVSAVDAPETYIFPAGPDGMPKDMLELDELDGSFRGSLDHQQALRNAGYELLAIAMEDYELSEGNLS